MSDLGTEAGASALKFANKSWEILFKLVGKLFDAWLKAPERKERKLRALQAQREEDKFNALTELSGMTGYVNHELLVKSGQELSLCGIYLTDEEILFLLLQIRNIRRQEKKLFMQLSVKPLI